MSLFHLAGLIANVEGNCNYMIELPESLETCMDMASLAKRTRAIEVANRITPPPPMVQTTIDALVYRVMRVHTMVYEPNAGTIQIERMAPVLGPLGSDMSVETVKEFIDGLGDPTLAWPDLKVEEEPLELGVMLQKLCHLAGRYRFKVELSERNHLFCLYSLATQLSLRLERMGEFGGPIRYPVPCERIVRRPRPPVTVYRERSRSPIRIRERRNVKRSRAPVSISNRKEKSQPRKRSWWSKLAFWRKKNDDDEDSGSDYDSDGGSSIASGRTY